MRYKILVAAVAVLFAAIVFSGFDDAFANTAGSLPAYCGAPSDGTTCAISGCHSDNAETPVAGWITSNIPAGGYTPGVTYTISATATYIGLNKFGFEISPQDAGGNVLGTLVNTSTDTHVLTGNKYITQTTAGTVGSDSKTWTFDWTAPASGSGTISFYGAFVCANGNNLSTGDFVYTSALTVNEAPTAGTDAGIRTINYPSVFACDSVLDPVVTLSNFGNTTIDSVRIAYYADAAAPVIYHWNGNLPAGASATVTLPAYALPGPGTHTFTATASFPNGGADASPANDSKSKTFSGTFAPVQLPLTEGFENAAFPPAGWTLRNPDNGITWSRVTYVHRFGNACALLHNYGYHSIGQQDELILPAIDLSAASAPQLDFYVAYRQYADSAAAPVSDTLSILVSTDCGTTWTLVYKKFGSALTTVTPDADNFQFQPDTTMWRQETVPLSDFILNDDVVIKFVNTTHYGNELFLDGVSVGEPNGVAEENPLLPSMEMYPNPANTQLTVSLRNFSGAAAMDIFDLSGACVMQTQTTHPETVLDVAALAPGVYVLEVKSGDAMLRRKFIRL